MSAQERVSEALQRLHTTTALALEYEEDNIGALGDALVLVDIEPALHLDAVIAGRMMATLLRAVDAALPREKDVIRDLWGELLRLEMFGTLIEDNGYPLEGEGLGVIESGFVRLFCESSAYGIGEPDCHKRSVALILTGSPEGMAVCEEHYAMWASHA